MERNKKIVIASVMVSVMVLFIGIAFAALASNLNISFGNVTQNALTWNVGFKGSSIIPTQEGTSSTGLFCGTASVTPSTVTISDSTLSKPGDKCTYPLVIENKGDIAANLSNIAATAPTDVSCNISGSTMVCRNITYELQAFNGNALTAGVTINKTEEYNTKLIVSYTGTELNSTPVTQSNAKFTLTYTQAENRTGNGYSDGIDSTSAKCRRARNLHTETCSWTSNKACYATGYYEGGSKNTTTITYGSLGTSGTLASGDAFDCDVNGDGTYDATTERFYYVSQVDGDSANDYATLIYYTNVSAGVPNNTARFKYHSENVNNLGPTVAYQQLPTTTQWSNVSLSNQTRQIYSHENTTSTSAGALPQFTYTDRAARLLSHKEVNAGCGITMGNATTGELDNCGYLLEHTYYSTNSSSVNAEYWWLESPHASSSNIVWAVYGVNRFVGRYGDLTSVGVRPAIEVLKTDIDY